MMTVRDYCAAMSALEFADPVAMIGAGRAVVLAPHPDDETLGCGGLIAALCAAGRPPVVVILTDGAGSHPDTPAFPTERLVALRRDEARQAVTLLGLPAADLVFLDQPDAALAREGAVLDEVIGLIRREGCTAVFASSPHDPHCDHVAAAALAAQAAAAVGVSLWYYPVWTWMREPDEAIGADGVAGWRLDIGAVGELKQAAISAHRSQYGAAIPGLAAGFALPPGLLAIAARNFEVFVAP